LGSEGGGGLRRASIDLHRAEVGFVERAEREVGVTLAWRLADGLGVTLAELVEPLI